AKGLDPQGHARTGTQNHSESSAGPSLEPQTGSPGSVHQLSRPALQDSRRRPPAQPLQPPPGGYSGGRRHSRRLKNSFSPTQRRVSATRLCFFAPIDSTPDQTGQPFG